MKKIFLIAIAIIAIILLSLPVFFYFKKEKSDQEKAIEICIEECRKAMIAGKDLSNGPCLLNPIKELPDWVCDVAHNPRVEIDNLKENQCSAFYEGKAKHFVEVDITCKLIKVY